MQRAIFILTTEGPVRIQRIAEEDPTVRSAICFDGRAEALPISAAYDAFVRRPTGIIERLTGHASYRLDVDARVDDGQSWQLAVYLAHVSALDPSPSDIAVFATGEVDRDGAIHPVQHVAEKLAALTEAWQRLGIDPAHAMVLVPPGQEGATVDIAGLSLRGVADVGVAAATTGIALPECPPTHADTNPPSTLAPTGGGRPVLLASVSVAIAAGVVFWFASEFARWSGILNDGRLLELEAALADADRAGGVDALRTGLYRRWLAWRLPGDVNIDVEGALALAPAPNCAGTSDRETVLLSATQPSGSAVCAVDVRAFSEDANVRLVGRLAYWFEGTAAADRATRVMRGSDEPGGRRWHIEFERAPGPGSVLRLVLVAGVVQVSGSQPWYVDLMKAPTDSAAYKAGISRLERLGFRVSTYDWRFE